MPKREHGLLFGGETAERPGQDGGQIGGRVVVVFECVEAEFAELASKFFGVLGRMWAWRA
jgi:hypothetical protein